MIICVPLCQEFCFRGGKFLLRDNHNLCIGGYFAAGDFHQSLSISGAWITNMDPKNARGGGEEPLHLKVLIWWLAL